MEGRADSVERLLVDPHEGPRLVGLAFVLDAAEFVAELAVLPLVVVVVFRLPDRLKRSCLVELDRKKITNTAALILTFNVMHQKWQKLATATFLTTT